MQCNIDAKGKAVRLLMGTAMVSAGLTMLGLTISGVKTGGQWRWGLVVVLIGVGLFQIWEGWSGWCVLRAMGFKTRV